MRSSLPTRLIHRPVCLLGVTCVTFWGVGPLLGHADDAPIAGPKVDFSLEVRPILARRTNLHQHQFALDRFPATARRYVRFLGSGGYENPRWWSERGWAWLQETGHRAPQGWRRDADGQWLWRQLGRWQPLPPDVPVQHIRWFEADAFARWSGGRLPTEVEWEKAARWDPIGGTARRFPWGDDPWTPARANLGVRRLGPAAVGSYPAGASAYGVEQLAGDVYEWTSSQFVGWPGFEAFPYREYSEVFFDGDYRVLRGSSWAIGVPFARATYRNWDHPYRRQVLAGVRVAYDLPVFPQER